MGESKTHPFFFPDPASEAKIRICGEFIPDENLKMTYIVCVDGT